MTDNSHALYISRLDVNLSQQSQKQAKAIKLQIRNTTLKDFHATISPGGSHSETFIPALMLTRDDQFSVSVQCHTRFRDTNVKITIDYPEILSGVQESGGIQIYQKSERNLDVVISLHFLPPTTNEIIQSCPRFRVLIIGNSGVGKSSLIHKMFGVNEVHVADNQRGRADIDREFVSSQNERFVLHDSKGFEEGDTGNVKVVQDFVKRHREEPQIKDRLHAVWMCFEVPYSDGRLLQSVAEDFFRRRHEVLGDVPLVVVLTKVDLLDEQLEIEMMEDGSDGRTLEKRKADFLEEHCFRPLRAVAGEVPCVIVSMLTQYSTTPTDIIKITKDCVNSYIGEETGMVFAMAQRASIKVNIESSIAIGRKKYWSKLAKSAFFSGYSMKECVQVLHGDIITVWNFHDPDQVLQQEDFIGALLRMGDLEEQEQASPPIDVSPVMGLAKAIAGSSPEPTLVILFSVVGAAIWLAQLAQEAYQRTTKAVKLLMLYIVGSVFVMQIIFLLTPDGRVTSQVVDQAIHTYLLAKRQRIREQIDEFNVEFGLLPGGPDYVLKRVELLIESCRIEDDEIEELRKTVRPQTEEPKRE